MQSEDRYCATLAHKTNHSFLPNAQFVVFEHPKFGLIPAVMVTQDLEQGEEVSIVGTPAVLTLCPPCRSWCPTGTTSRSPRCGTSRAGSAARCGDTGSVSSVQISRYLNPEQRRCIT